MQAPFKASNSCSPALAAISSSLDVILPCIPASSVLSGLSMETTTKSVLTDLQAFDVASLKGRLSELRRYL